MEARRTDAAHLSCSSGEGPMFVMQHCRTRQHDAFCHHKTLDVLLTLNNYKGYRSRYTLFDEFVKHISSFSNENTRLRLHVVEIALGDKLHYLNPNDPAFHTVLLLRTECQLWHKENSLNLLAQRLPADCEYIAWIDADVTFLNSNWVSDTLNALQRFDIVQPWMTSVDLGPQGQVIAQHESFGWRYHKNDFDTSHLDQYKFGGHTGYAWACTMRAFEQMGGLFETAVLGAGDNHMAHAFVQKAQYSYNKDVSDSYKNKVLLFEERCKSFQLGYVNGTIAHHFHGRKEDRQYYNRWKILVRNGFDPNRHITRDRQGLLYIIKTQETKNLIRDIANYFAIRNEDSIDLDPPGKK